jgi:hypothetical protein
MTNPHGMWVWRKSSFSEGNNDTACVEVGHWRKSTHSEASGNTSGVEVGFRPDLTAIRDSKNPDGGMLTLSSAAWAEFRETAAGTQR